MSEPLYPWEQREDESPEAFEGFSTYRDLGIDRSLSQVSAKLGKSMTLLERWSSRDSWVARAQGWDRHTARQQNNQVLAGRASMRQRFITQAKNAQHRAATRILSMSEDEIRAMKPGEAMQMLRIASEIEFKARSISEDELESGDREFSPTFKVEFVPTKPPEMIVVQMPDGATGYIPATAREKFQADHPLAVVIV